ncbi:MAG: sigma-70 family RNA polymerase sigma factor [Oscillospiraceae bacterium]|nr:sigma-70 family RNA polymerase sigma factor [Oscillospiraceae bacterium]
MLQEIKELIVKAQKGDREAMGELVAKNRGLIHSAVLRFKGRGETDDLFQIGAMGLMKAVRRFDMSYDVEFSTYAVPMIIGEIKRFLRDDGIIKVSRSYKELARRAYSIMERRGELGMSELAAELSVSPEELIQAMEAVRPPDSIDRPMAGTDGRLSVVLDALPSEDREDDLIMRICLKQAINSLPSRERSIIVLRYFKDKTQSEVAGILGLSQVQISRLEKKVLARMREEIG